MDRLLAALGLLDDALPLFAPVQNLPRAGVLLAVPALVWDRDQRGLHDRFMETVLRRG